MLDERAAAIDEGFRTAVARMREPNADDPRRLRGMPAALALEVLDSQLRSRQLDFAARDLRGRGVGFYTIGSSGHEGNAAVAAAARPTDPAFLHYRSGGFFVQRARQVPGQDPERDVLLGIVASRDDPIAGGRHKVFGSAKLSLPPQTSTIASHLPKAVGLAFALERGQRLGLDTGAPRDAIVLCSFGDASTSHSTALGAINSASRTAHQHFPMPLLFVCEDNGLGISVKTPEGFIAQTFSTRPSLRYFFANGLDLVDAFTTAAEAMAYVRETRRPAFLHLQVVRLMGHAGSDVELTYRTPEEIRADDRRDPLVRSAEILVEAGVTTPREVVDRYDRIRDEIAALCDEVAERPRLRDAKDVMAPLAPHSAEAVAAEAARAVDPQRRERLWNGRAPSPGHPLTLAASINATLSDLLAKYPEMLVFGEDVARKGGVYGVTRGLHQRAGAQRVFDTLLDEQAILGVAIGAGQAGMLPVPEIQYLAYLHNAEDQLRGEAATLRFFSSGQFRNPMVVRIAGYAYQRGFGGHFHNDNSVAVLRDIPGIIIASPARAADAAGMLRTCVAAARVDGAVCVFIEPIALYNTKDLYEDGDGAYMDPYAPQESPIAVGRARSYGSGRDLLLVSFANGLRMSLRAAKELEDDHGLRSTVLDLRWLAPLPVEDLLRAARDADRVLVVDETRRTGGVSEGVISALVDRGYDRPMKRVASADSFVPLGEAANHVLVTEDDVVRVAVAMASGRR